MSEPEGFLSRWVRRKRESSEPTQAERAPDQSSEQAQTEPVARSVEEAPVQPEPPGVDLSALPPLESITATTDIRPFLAPGVPAELARAALRRAWVADPQIRNFIGIAENQWDFNDPTAIPGFGALGPLDARRLLAAALGGSEEPAASPPAAAADASVGDTPVAAAVATPEQISPPEADAAATQPASDIPTSEPVAITDAAQKEDDPGSASATPIRRGHGGALPR